MKITIAIFSIILLSSCLTIRPARSLDKARMGASLRRMKLIACTTQKGLCPMAKCVPKKCPVGKHIVEVKALFNRPNGDCCLKPCNFKCDENKKKPVKLLQSGAKTGICPKQAGSCPMAKCAPKQCPKGKHALQDKTLFYGPGNSCCPRPCNIKCVDEKIKVLQTIKKSEICEKQGGFCPMAKCIPNRNCGSAKHAVQDMTLYKAKNGSCCPKVCMFSCIDNAKMNVPQKKPAKPQTCTKQAGLCPTAKCIPKLCRPGEHAVQDQTLLKGNNGSCCPKVCSFNCVKK